MLGLTMRRIHFDVTDSTNTQARLLAAIHPGERVLVTAAEQTAGRGRQGRQWLSPRGGAWMTIAWPMRLESSAYRTASLATAVGVRRSLLELATRGMPPEAAAFALDVRVKWPNDLLINDAKVAGILCEQSVGAQHGGDAIFIGIGVNVEFSQEILDEPASGEPLRHRATTLSNAAGRRIEVPEVIERTALEVAAAMEQLEACGFAGTPAEGRSSLLDELRDALAYIGEIRRWRSPRGDVTGRVLGIDDDGRLLLEGDAGVIVCDAGELETNDRPR